MDMRDYDVWVRIGVAQWWATIGGTLFTVGLLFILLAYSTQQAITTVPSNYVGRFPFISYQAFNIGTVLAGIGVILVIYGRFKLSMISKMRQ